MINASVVRNGVTKVLKSKKFIFALGIVGVGLTAVTSATGAILAKKHIEEAKEEKGRLLRDDNIEVPPEYVELTPVETVKVCWKDFVPAVASASFTICAFSKLFKTISGENLALQGMLSVSEATVQHLESKMIDKIGEKKAAPIITDAKQESFSENPPVEKPTKTSFLEGANADDIIRVCVDSDMRTFKTTKLLLQKAMEQINLDLHDYGETSLNNFYEYVGQPDSKIGDSLVWRADSMNDYKLEIIWDSMWNSAYVDSDGHAWTYIRFTKDPEFHAD